MVYKKKVGGTKKRVYRRRARVPPTKKPTFAKRVKSVISKMAENKNVNFHGTVPLYPYGSTLWGDGILTCTPDSLFLAIDQGVGQGDRVGNSIRVKSLKMTGVLRTLPYNAITNPNPCPFYVKMFFLTRKDTPTDVFGSLEDLLRFGNSAESPGHSGFLQNLYRPVNTDNWTIHTTRIFKLGYGSYTGTSTDPDQQAYSNNDFKLNHFINIDLTKYCTKQIKFNDNTTTPSTRNIVMYPVVYTADGTNQNNYQMCKMDVALDIVYEDI